MEITHQQLQDMMAKTVAAAIAEMKKPNALELRQIEEAEAAEKRRAQMVKALGQAEAEAMRKRKSGCTHSVWPNSAGRLAGHSAPRGEGQWCTGGQQHGDGTISVICLRCANTWTFKATNEELQSVPDSGLLGAPVPPAERWIQTCGYCNQPITGDKEYQKHIETCVDRPKKAS